MSGLRGDLGKEVGSACAVGEHVVENDEVRTLLLKQAEGIAGTADAGKTIATQGLGIETQLLGIVFDNEDRRFSTCLGSNT